MLDEVREVKVLTILMDQGPIGRGMSAFLQFFGVHAIHFSWDPFHRIMRDMALDVSGIGPRFLRRELMQSQLCSSYAFSLSYRPYQSGGYATAKKELLDHFLSTVDLEDNVCVVLSNCV